MAKKCRFCYLEVDTKESHTRVLIRGEYSFFCNSSCHDEWSRMNGVFTEAANPMRERRFIFAGGRDYGDENDAAIATTHPPNER